jgi:hypothetical protein
MNSRQRIGAGISESCGAQPIVHLELQRFGDVEHSLIRQRGGAIEPAPRHQHASRRPGIIAAMAQEKHIAQCRLVLAAARDARTGGGGFQRQAAPPHPGERHVRAYPGIEHGQRGAGLERGPSVGVGVGDRRLVAGPAWQRRRNRQNCVCVRCLRGADHGESYHVAALLATKRC